MDDGIIDLTQYLEDPPADAERGAFALWGADEGRSRFALPLWRAVYLVEGRRGGILIQPSGDPRPRPRPFVVLDLLHDPAELDFPPLGPPETGATPPVLHREGPGRISVFLGSTDAGSWYLVLESEPRDDLGPGDREDLLFLAGECAGLLFLRGLADVSAEARISDDEPEADG